MSTKDRYAIAMMVWGLYGATRSGDISQVVGFTLLFVGMGMWLWSDETKEQK